MTDERVDPENLGASGREDPQETRRDEAGGHDQGDDEPVHRQHDPVHELVEVLVDEPDLDLAVADLLERVVELVRERRQPCVAKFQASRRARAATRRRRVAADHQAAGVRLGDLEDVEVRRELDGRPSRAWRSRGRAGRTGSGDAGSSGRSSRSTSRIDLERVDLLERRAVVAVEELAQLGDELLLALLRVADAEVAEPSRQRLDVLVRDVDEEPRRLGDVLVGQPAGEPEVDEADLVGREDEDVRRVRDRRGRSRGGRSSSSTCRRAPRRAGAAPPRSYSSVSTSASCVPSTYSSVSTRGRVYVQ